eukprot:Nk52_evm73s2118 gene=Nk52_evmTU73s2118
MSFKLFQWIFVLLLVASTSLYSEQSKANAQLLLRQISRRSLPFAISETEKTQVNQGGSTALYGELTYTGLQQLLRGPKEGIVTEDDVIFDLGSGNGNTCIYFALHTKGCIGVELSRTRYRASVLVANQANPILSKRGSLVKFYWANMLDFPFGRVPATILFINHLFKADFSCHLFLKIKQEIKTPRKILSLHYPFGIFGTEPGENIEKEENNGFAKYTKCPELASYFEYVGPVYVETSWTRSRPNKRHSGTATFHYILFKPNGSHR